jgi:hypothetical protein
MIDRRHLLTVTGLLGAFAPHAGGEASPAAAQQLSPQNAQDIVNALGAIRTAIAAGPSFVEILPVRQKQLDYLKANGKFPDFIDVGSDVWYAVHDWHVRTLQPLVFGRDPVLRYTLMLGFTALVLRPEAVTTFISTPYDNR